MFGQDNTQANQPSVTPPDNVVSAAMPEPLNHVTPPPAGFGLPNGPSGFPASPVPPGSPTPDSSAPELPSVGPASPSTASSDHFSSTTGSSSVPVTVNDDLVAIKQQALDHLGPLVGHLDQTPEEKFRTTMMMIQASDNKDLIKDAFEAAQKITDEKARAQALLDVINEINYFTQHDNKA